MQLCAIAGGVPAHNFERRAILVGAGDHGVAADGVSAYPPDVTAQMVGGFLAGTAAINAFARAVRAEVYVANFGVRAPLATHPRLIDVNAGPVRRTSRGAGDRPAELDGVLAAGAPPSRVAARARVRRDRAGRYGDRQHDRAPPHRRGLHGIGAKRRGRGTGVDDAGFERKVAAIEAALGRCGDLSWREIASEAGGFEIVGLAGVMLAAAQARVPIVLDGFIVAAAALIAAAIAPNVLDYCIAAHRSQEAGHGAALRALRLTPLLDLDLRLGEASGAALALPIVEAAARMVREMRTFAEAGVARSAPPERSRAESAASRVRLLLDPTGRRRGTTGRGRPELVAARRHSDRCACRCARVAGELGVAAAAGGGRCRRRRHRAQRRDPSRRLPRCVRRIVRQRRRGAAPSDSQGSASRHLRARRARDRGSRVDRRRGVAAARRLALGLRFLRRRGARGSAGQRVAVWAASGGASAHAFERRPSAGVVAFGALLAAVCCRPQPGLALALLPAVAAALALGAWCARRLGGVLTGDCYGAIVVVLEVALLVTIASVRAGPLR